MSMLRHVVLYRRVGRMLRLERIAGTWCLRRAETEFWNDCPTRGVLE